MFYWLEFVFIELSLRRTRWLLLYLNSAVSIGQYWAQVLVFCHINKPQLFFFRNHIKCQSLLIYEIRMALHLLRKNMTLYKKDKILAIHYYIYEYIYLPYIITHILYYNNNNFNTY